MSKVIRKGNTVIVIFKGGNSVKRKNVSNVDYQEILKNKNNDEKLLSLMVPKIAEIQKKKEVAESIFNSHILSKVGNSVYWREVSPLSVPEDLATLIVEAEKLNDKVKIQTYKNFWTLLSLNPDEECRKNLFWFIQRTGIKISRSGFFVAYRNVVKTNRVDAYGNPVYTDEHSHSTTIVIGKPVQMDRDKTDRNSNVTCSRGLHLGASWWLQKNYFGDTGVVCLCNPAKVVAVPRLDQYGKLRTCEYIPIDYITYDNDGKVIPYNVDNGFECKYVANVIYEGLLGTENSAYTIDIPEIPGIEPNIIKENLLEIARESIKNKIIC